MTAMQWSERFSGFIGDASQNEARNFVCVSLHQKKGGGDLMILIWPDMTERANCGCSIVFDQQLCKKYSAIWNLRSSKLSRLYD